MAGWDWLKLTRAGQDLNTGWLMAGPTAGYFLLISNLKPQTSTSSSGPLSLAFSFETPFAISYPLSCIFDTFDLKLALKDFGLKKSDLVFDSFNNLSRFEKTKRLAGVVRRRRNYERLPSLWMNLFSEFETEEVFAPSFDVIK